MKNKIQLTKGDITKITTDAIVNAANSSLLGGGGVDGAIHRAGGPDILDACRKIRARQGGCATGEAVITTAGKLPSKYVIHTVGPVWSETNAVKSKMLLESCYTSSLKLAVENEIKSISFPNISTGIYKFPKDLAAEIAIRTVQEFLSLNDAIDEVIFVCFDDENYNLYSNALN